MHELHTFIPKKPLCYLETADKWNTGYSLADLMLTSNLQFQAHSMISIACFLTMTFAVIGAFIILSVFLGYDLCYVYMPSYPRMTKERDGYHHSPQVPLNLVKFNDL